MATVRVTLNQAGLDRMLRQPGGLVHRNVVDRVLRATHALATVAAPVDTGFLRNDTSIEIKAGPGSMHGALTYHAHYAIFVLKGTGMHGPRAALIEPKTAEYMVFRGRDGSLVYAKTTKGQRAQPFLQNAFRAASPWPVTIH